MNCYWNLSLDNVCVMNKFMFWKCMFYIHQFIISESKVGCCSSKFIGNYGYRKWKIKKFLFLFRWNGKNNFFDEDLALFFGREEFEDVINFLMESLIIYDKKKWKEILIT